MRSPATTIRLLGTVSIDHADVPTPVAFPGGGSELVFAYLAAEHHREVSRGELADALWPKGLPGAWAAELRGVVGEVRRVLAAAGLGEGDLLERTGDGYRLRLPPDAVVDIDQARSALASAGEGVERDPAAAAADATLAEELARLPFLPRHEGDWVDAVRQELEGILVGSLELSTRAYLRAGDRQGAAAAAARQRALETADVRATDVPAVEGPASAPAVSPFASHSVLVVDDHDFQRRTALALLERLGVGSLAEASDGADALERLARSDPPDIIVCDIDMPGMDGVEFIRHVAKRRLASAVVIASGLERGVLQAVEAVGEGYGLQVLGTLEKPLTARGLSELLTAYRRPPPTAGRSEPSVATDDELRAALDGGHIGARYLPIVDLHHGAISGARAFATWESRPEAPPCVVTEDVSVELTTRLRGEVLAIVCDQLSEITAAGMGIALWTAIGQDVLADIDRADRLLAIVRERNADPKQLVWAVGERAVRRSTPSELDVLARLRVKGFGICLEDFGGGRVSDDAFAHIPFTAVALAPSLVGGAAGDPARSTALEEALEAIGARGLPAVARGCEDAADYELLVEIGCRHAEGGFIGGPMPGEELVGWVRDWSAPSIVEESP